MISADGRDGNPESETLELIAARARTTTTSRSTSPTARRPATSRPPRRVRGSRSAADPKRGFAVALPRREADLSLTHRPRRSRPTEERARAAIEELQARADALGTAASPGVAVTQALRRGRPGAVLAVPAGPARPRPSSSPRACGGRRRAGRRGRRRGRARQAEELAPRTRPARPARAPPVHRPRPRGLAPVRAGDPAGARRRRRPRHAPTLEETRSGRGGARLPPRGPARRTSTTATGTSSTPRAAGPSGRAARTARASSSSTCTSRCSPATTRSGARVGLGPVVPFADYRAPIGEGLRGPPAGPALRDVDLPDTSSSASAELEGSATGSRRGRRRRLRDGDLIESLGRARPLEEPTARHAWLDVWHHGSGHVSPPS